MKRIFLSVYFLGILNSFAQQHSVFAKTDTTNIRIGEQFLYFIVADNVKEVLFPAADSLGLESLEVVKEYNTDTLKDKLVKKYLLTGFDSGSYYIPNQAVFIDKKAHFTDSLLIKIATVEVDTTKIYRLVKGIEEEPMKLRDYTPKFILFFAILIAVLLAVLGYYLYRRYVHKKKLKKSIPPKHPFEQAKESFAILDAKKDYLEQAKIKDYYTDLTEIVRTYLGRRFGIHTLEATTDEILKNLSTEIKKQQFAIDNEFVHQLSAFLKHADFVKFAKLIPLPSEIKDDRANAWRIIENFETVFRMKEQEEKDTDSDKKSTQ